jgi:hypothetical protein
MTFVNVQNTSNRPVMVPARGGLSVVLSPGEQGTVCPEGQRGQGRFHAMMSRGMIRERGRVRNRTVAYIPTRHTFDHPQAA